MGNEAWQLDQDVEDNQQFEAEYVRPDNLSDETANMVLEVHGEFLTVEEGLRRCKPFRAMAGAILDVPGGDAILQQAVHKMAEQAFVPLDESAKKNSSSSSLSPQLRY